MAATDLITADNWRTYVLDAPDVKAELERYNKVCREEGEKRSQIVEQQGALRLKYISTVPGLVKWLAEDEAEYNRLYRCYTDTWYRIGAFRRDRMVVSNPILMAIGESLEFSANWTMFLALCPITIPAVVAYAVEHEWCGLFDDVVIDLSDQGLIPSEARDFARQAWLDGWQE